MALGVWLLLQPEKETQSMVRVDIEGGIKKPGVYELEEGAILQDLVNLAGGFSKNADTIAVAQEINLAKILVDGEKIFIPVKTKSAKQESSTNKININTAEKSDLIKLPGIGPVLAQRIIDFKNQKGRIDSLEELEQVKGIGASLVQKIRDLIEF